MQCSLHVALACCLIFVPTLPAAFVELPSGQLPLTLTLTTNGYQVSIPDDKSTDYVIIRIHHNFDLYTDSVVISEPTDGSWNYENINGRPKAGDILFIWTGVQSGPVSYYRHNDITIGDNDVYRTNSMCEATETIVPNQAVCKGQLLFEETFDGVTQLNSTRWQHEIRIPLEAEDAEFVVFDDRRENCYVRDGLLNIVPTLWMNDAPGSDIRVGELDLGLKCTGFTAKECIRRPAGIIHNVIPPVVSARIQTKHFFNFKYGRVDIRAKVAHGDWLLPLMLLEPLAHVYGSRGFASGQLRIAFARGNEHLINQANEEIGGRTLYGGVVLTRGEALRELSLLSFTNLSGFYGDDFHVFSLIWTSSSMSFTVDGLPYAEITGGFSEIYKQHVAYAVSWKSGNIMAPFDQLFYLTLGVSVGGHSDFPNGVETGPEDSRRKKPWINNDPKAAYNFWKDRSNWKRTWKDETMQVDYVRVYAL